MKERIQKVLAAVGHGSRRDVERWIVEGRLSVNGQPAEPGVKVDQSDTIRLDGRPLSLRGDGEVRVLAYRKRVGQVVTRRDPQDRPTVFKKLPRITGARWIAVGRLDINTSGLLLMTTSGELAKRLMHPSHGIEREYAVRVHGRVDDAMLDRLRRGVELDDGMAAFDRLSPGGGEGSNQWYTVQLHEGRNRVVRRLWESQGVEVSRLIRVRFGPVEMRGIKDGGYRELAPEEVAMLTEMVGLQDETGRKPARGAGKAPRRKAPVSISAATKPSAPKALRRKPRSR